MNWFIDLIKPGIKKINHDNKQSSMGNDLWDKCLKCEETVLKKDIKILFYETYNLFYDPMKSSDPSLYVTTCYNK